MGLTGSLRCDAGGGGAVRGRLPGVAGLDTGQERVRGAQQPLPQIPQVLLARRAACAKA